MVRASCPTLAPDSRGWWMLVVAFSFLARSARSRSGGWSESAKAQGAAGVRAMLRSFMNEVTFSVQRAEISSGTSA